MSCAGALMVIIPEFSSYGIYIAYFTLAVGTISLMGGLFMRKKRNEDKGIGVDQSVNVRTNIGGQVAQNIYNFEDNSPMEKVRELFNQIDPRVNGLLGVNVVRMEPSQFIRLVELIDELGNEAPLSILRIVSKGRGNTINNGSLGITYPSDENYNVELRIHNKLDN